MIISSWNIRGLNKSLKQNGILNHVKKNKVAIMGILETKIRKHRMMEIVKNRFKSWEMANNFQHSPNGRIMIIWKKDKVDLEIKDSNAQAIHCLVTCKSTSNKFYFSFVHGLNKLVERRNLWRNLCRFNSFIDLPWLLLGDFNVVLKGEEKSNGLPATQYEMSDF